MREINLQKLREDSSINIWDLPFFSTSDSEDNDTESEDEESESVEKCDEFHEIKLRESMMLEEYFKTQTLSEKKLSAFNRIK